MQRTPRPARRLLLVLVAAAVALAGCTTPAPPPDDGAYGGDGGDGGDDGDPGSNDNNGASSGVFVPRPADASQLLSLVHDQVYVDGDPDRPRYRTPGTQGHDEAIPILEAMLVDRGLTVELETFSAELPELGTVGLTNLYGTRQGADPSAGEVWLAAHWDSRAWADEDPDPSRHDEPVLGANDGAAGVAVVVHALDRLPSTNLTVRVALFDGEDQGQGGSGWAVGSAHAAQVRSGTGELARITALLLVDMPGDKQLMIKREAFGERSFPRLHDLVFTTAEALGAPSFQNITGPAIVDDHVAFVNEGVPSVDLIHLDDDDRRGPFPWTHHTTQDTPENLSGERMAEVTDVVVSTVVAIDHGHYDGEA